MVNAWWLLAMSLWGFGVGAVFITLLYRPAVRRYRAAIASYKALLAMRTQSMQLDLACAIARMEQAARTQNVPLQDMLVLRMLGDAQRLRGYLNNYGRNLLEEQNGSKDKADNANHNATD